MTSCLRTILILSSCLFVLTSCPDNEDVGPVDPPISEEELLPSFQIEEVDTTILTGSHFYVTFDIPADKVPSDVIFKADKQSLAIIEKADSTILVAAPEGKQQVNITLEYEGESISIGQVETADFEDIAPVDVGYTAVNDTLYAGVFAGTAVQFSPMTYAMINDTLQATATFDENGYPELLVINDSAYYLTNYTDSTVEVFDTAKPFDSKVYYVKAFLDLFGGNNSGRTGEQDVQLQIRMAMTPFLMAIAQITLVGERLPSSYVQLPEEVPGLYDRFLTISRNLADYKVWTINYPGDQVYGYTHDYGKALIWATHYYHRVAGGDIPAYYPLGCAQCMQAHINNLMDRLYLFYKDKLQRAKEQANVNTPRTLEQYDVWGYSEWTTLDLDAHSQPFIMLATPTDDTTEYQHPNGSHYDNVFQEFKLTYPEDRIVNVSMNSKETRYYFGIKNLQSYPNTRILFVPTSIGPTTQRNLVDIEVFFYININGQEESYRGRFYPLTQEDTEDYDYVFDVPIVKIRGGGVLEWMNKPGDTK